MAAEVLTHRSLLKTVTPMMQQYIDVKNQYEEYILLYRLGDFYECFFEDALTASSALELTLTGRDCGDGKRAAMCGVPFHKADVYIGKLVERGFKVAVCEQVSDPKSSVGLVKREVVRVVTPGTITDGALLNAGKNNFLAAVYCDNDGTAVCFADISTGEVSATYIPQGDDMALKLFSELSAYQPAEIILNVPSSDFVELKEYCQKNTVMLTDSTRRLFDYERARECTRRVFADEVDRFENTAMMMSVGALVSYVDETQKSEVAFARELNIYSGGQYLEVDLNTRRNLELVESMRTKQKRGSLLWVLDKTKTAMGARLLRSYILKPLVNPVAIGHRQAAVSDLVKRGREREELGELLSGMLDLERLVAKAVYGTANAKDLRSIYQGLVRLPAIKQLLLGFESGALVSISRELDTLDDVAELIDRAIALEPPYTVREGDIIRDGYNSDVDYYRAVKGGGTQIMESIEERERELTGIKSLRVGYNKVFGYYIEVTKSFVDLVPDYFIRKQTLTNCERYITQELKEMESTVFSAQDNLVAVEYDIFCAVRDFVVANSERIRHTAALVAEIDVYRSLAEVADKNAYVCPEVDLSSELIIKDGRHPVVEKFVTDTYFVPNDTHLDTADRRIMIITGPNMAGKSTYMRQVAVITIMAQIGSFVPAREARIGIVDKVFTRVGASDDLASGQSTFMLEMNEVAAILRNATKRSLIIYDEVGRGTSTYDGMAIARAVVEYTHSRKVGAKTLFATHYHELTDMEGEFDGIVNYNIAAKKRGDSIIFLRKIVRGGTDDSYGIEVAKLAGVPNEVIKRAREILAGIEAASANPTPRCVQAANDTFDIFSQIAASKDGEVADRLRQADLNTLTPIEAMNLLYELKKMLS